MNMEAKIKAAIEAGIPTQKIEITNDSQKHIGHSGDDGSGETHFKLMIVSSHFEKHNSVQRQRIINSLIKPLFKEGLHAITMRLQSLEEADI